MTDTLPLETLNQKLERLIEEWKKIHENSYSITFPTVGERLAEFIVMHPELLHAQPSIPELVDAMEQAVPTYYSPDGLEGALIPQLLALPDEIRRLQEAFNKADYLYQLKLTTLSIKALNEPLFAGKEPGTLRPASNEVERNLAIAELTQESSELKAFNDTRENALANLQQAKNRLECARLVIQLVCKGNGK